MRFRTRILIIVAAALIGMTVIATAGLLQLRQSMYEERQSQIAGAVTEAVDKFCALRAGTRSQRAAAH